MPKVKVLKGLVGAGISYSKGGTYEVSDKQAKEWAAAGYCTVEKSTVRSGKGRSKQKDSNG